jgi:hypothetical protein
MTMNCLKRTISSVMTEVSRHFKLGGGTDGADPQRFRFQFLFYFISHFGETSWDITDLQFRKSHNFMKELHSPCRARAMKVAEP